MKAFHSDPKIKDYYLQRVRSHAAADEIAKGQYVGKGKNGKPQMCAVGCTIHGSDHSAYERELGIPQILARLEDRIFENLPEDLMKTWPDRFLSAITVGTDLSKVWPKFAIFLLIDPTQCASRHPQCDVVATAYQQSLDGVKIDWRSVRSADAVTPKGGLMVPASPIGRPWYVDYLQTVLEAVKVREVLDDE